MNKLLWLAILCLCVAVPASVTAGTTNARDYVPLPPGTTTINLYYSHGFGNELYTHNDKISDNANLTTNIGIVRPVHYMQLGPFTIDPQAIIPFGEVELNGQRSSGIGDITFLSTIWLVNNMEKGYYFAYSPYITIPSGPYRRENLVNLGSNRWSFKQELAVGKRLADKAWLELIGNVEFFTNNIDAPDADNKPVTSSKDPLYGVEFHASYDLTKDFFVSGDYYFAYGAETTLDGVRLNDRTCTHTVGASFFYMLTPHMQFMADYKLPVSVQNGIKTNSITCRLTYVF